mmetsp:Transcript_131274/g.379765  ORF Transcript_131274/g.379765 Transcript_131274/m.379765 type:complete len:249 (-) Transcript_131274:110-856(-)
MSKRSAPHRKTSAGSRSCRSMHGSAMRPRHPPSLLVHLWLRIRKHLRHRLKVRHENSRRHGRHRNLRRDKQWHGRPDANACTGIAGHPGVQASRGRLSRGDQRLLGVLRASSVEANVLAKKRAELVNVGNNMQVQREPLRRDFRCPSRSASGVHGVRLEDHDQERPLRWQRSAQGLNARLDLAAVGQEDMWLPTLRQPSREGLRLLETCEPAVKAPRAISDGLAQRFLLGLEAPLATPDDAPRWVGVL